MTLRTTPEYLSWANGRVHASLAALPSPPARAVGLLGHVLASEHLWLCRMNSDEPRLEIWPELGLDVCPPLIVENVEGYSKLLESLNASNTPLDQRTITYTNSKGEKFTNSVADVLLHVLCHGSYHRGQIAIAVKQAGGTSAQTDLIDFCRRAVGCGSSSEW